jgi:hypothetical protein
MPQRARSPHEARAVDHHVALYETTKAVHEPVAYLAEAFCFIATMPAAPDTPANSFEVEGCRLSNEGARVRHACGIDQLAERASLCRLTRLNIEEASPARALERGLNASSNGR